MITSILRFSKTFKSERLFWSKFNKSFAECDKYVNAKVSLHFPKTTSTDIYLIYLAETHQGLVVMAESAKPADKDELWELVDEEEFMDESPLWFSESSHRTSPAFYLKQFMDIFHDMLEHIDTSVNVQGLLLTDSSLINYDDQIDVYNDMDIAIKDKLTNMSKLNIPIIADDDPVIKLSVGQILNRANELKIKAETISSPEVSPLDNFECDDFDFDFDDIKLSDKDNTDSESLLPKRSFKAKTTSKANKATPKVDRGRFASVGEIARFLRENDNPIRIDASIDLPDVEVYYPLPEPDKALSQMVGLSSIKEKIADIACLAQYNNLKKEIGTPFHTLNLHATFSGNPGTGKSTMARIWAGMLHEHKQLTHGHLVLATRSSFVGTKWGMEEENLSKILQIAEGGVLMIDEAYSLVSCHPNDPGRLVLPLLLNRLADESRRNISVVLAGYPAEMANLLKTNPGITSRFANKFEFSDFSLEQLCEITRNKIAFFGYTFTPTAWNRYKEVLEEAYSRKDRTHFGNARYVANMLERIYLQHARRIVNSTAKNKNILSLTLDDIVPNEQPPTVKPGVGFNTQR